MEKQLDRLLERSSMIWDYLKKQQLDDSFGWQKNLEYLAENLPDGTTSGLLLTGPRGSGRHTAAYHFLKAIGENGFEPIFLSGTAFPAAADSRELLSAIVDRCYSDDAGMVLLLDLTEGDPPKTELYDSLTALCLEAALIEENSPFFLVLIEDSEETVPALLLSGLYHIALKLPSKQQRMKFFQATVGRDFIAADLAEQTAGCSYHQLKAISKSLELHVDTFEDGRIQAATRGEYLDADRMSQLIMRERAVSSRQESFYEKAGLLLDELPALLEKLPTVLERIPAFFDKLPALLERLPAGGSTAANVDAVPASQQKTESITSSDPETQEKELSNLPVATLLYDTFGKEGADELKKRVKALNHAQTEQGGEEANHGLETGETQ